MKKTPKKIFGILGLLAVILMTVFAATMPIKSASAAGTLTDTIIVTVKSNGAWIDIEYPANDSIISRPKQTVTFKYEELSKVTAQLIYTDGGGTTHTVDLDEIVLDDESGEMEIPVDISGYGYGDFTIKLLGEGTDGVPYEDAISIEYYPVITTVEQDPTTEDVFANLDYDLDNPDIDTIELNVYDADEPDKLLWTTTVPRGTTQVELPFAEENFLTGQYIIATIAHDASGDDLYEPYVVGLDYSRKSAPGEDVPVPNTGNLTNDFNISKTDYLITSLIILFITSVSGIYFITHRKRNSRK